MLENIFTKMFMVFLKYLPKENIVDIMIYIVIVYLIIHLTINVLKTISKRIIKF